MKKKILITVSDNISYLHGVRFVGSFFQDKKSVSATLFYVAPRADVAGRGPVYGEQELDKKAMETWRRKGQESIDAAIQMLCDRGFPPDNVSGKLIFRQFGTVKDIVREAKAGLYDAVILGRRGYMLFESVLSTSVTKEILDRDIDFPIWICRHPEENRKNVLLCVDGSDSSLRMVDHVGFMLKDENDHLVTLFHADTGEGQDKEAILREARGRLLDNWVSDGRINTLVIPSSITGVAKSILEQVEGRGYAAVAIGRVGVQKGRLREWLVGSRTMKLLETMEKASLWVGK